MAEGDHGTDGDADPRAPDPAQAATGEHQAHPSGDRHARRPHRGTESRRPYRASADGIGVFDSTGHFIRSWDITNDSGVAQHYAFNFFIYYGSMSTDQGIGGNGYAEYAVNIIRDGTTNLFSSSARIDSDGSPATVTGTALDGATQSGSSYYWNGTYVNVDLGILGIGESTSVVYDLVSHAYGAYDISSDCNGNGYGGDGYGDAIGVALAVVDGYGGGCTGTSYSSLGDPDNLNSTPIPDTGIVTTPAQVPEPATLGLLGMGLAALGLRRRRQRG
jgi:hypothetical protein